jgi:hypothetical protein
MIGIIIGLLLVALLGIGLYRRRKEDQAWVAEERYEESGAWIDKRSGERGTYGSLDRERETERVTAFQQGRLNALSDELETLLQLPARSLRRSKGALVEWLSLAENLLKTGAIPAMTTTLALNEPALSAKKLMLSRLYDWYPELLSAEITQLQHLDAHTGNLVQRWIA